MVHKLKMHKLKIKTSKTVLFPMQPTKEDNTEIMRVMKAKSEQHA